MEIVWGRPRVGGLTVPSHTPERALWALVALERGAFLFGVRRQELRQCVFRTAWLTWATVLRRQTAHVFFVDFAWVEGKKSI